MQDSTAKVPELPLSIFRELCDLASEYHQLAPWNYLSDSDMLAIEDPGTQKLRLVSVLGNRGEVFGLLVHRGERGLRWAFTLAFGQTGRIRLLASRSSANIPTIMRISALGILPKA